MAGDRVAQFRPLQPRHPELVSGPISRFARSKRGQTQSDRQVRPMRIVFVDQVDLPLPVPALELLFAQNRWFHLPEQLEMNESVNGILRGESGECVAAMLPDSADEIGRDPDIDCSVRLARKDVDAGLAFVSHRPEFAARWVLKQVQDDGLGKMVS